MFVVACFLFFVCLKFQIIRFVISTFTPIFFIPLFHSPPPRPRCWRRTLKISLKRTTSKGMWLSGLVYNCGFFFKTIIHIITCPTSNYVHCPHNYDRVLGLFFFLLIFFYFFSNFSRVVLFCFINFRFYSPPPLPRDDDDPSIFNYVA